MTNLREKLELVQYKAGLAITGAMQGTSRDNIYQELGSESPKSRRWYKRLSCMIKVMKEETPNYLIGLVSKFETSIRKRNNSGPAFNYRTDFFKYSFFPSTLNDWFDLDLNIKNSESISIFKSRSFSFIRPVQTKIYNIFDPKGLTFLTWLRLGLSHLNEHRCWHSFQECLSPLYPRSLETQNCMRNQEKTSGRWLLFPGFCKISIYIFISEIFYIGSLL